MDELLLSGRRFIKQLLRIIIGGTSRADYKPNIIREVIMDSRIKTLIVLLAALLAVLFSYMLLHTLVLTGGTQGEENPTITEDTRVAQKLSSSLQDSNSSIASDVNKEDFGTGISVMQSLNLDMPAVPDRVELISEKHNSEVRRYIYSPGTDETLVTILFENKAVHLGVTLEGDVSDVPVFKTIRGLALGDEFDEIYEKYGKPDLGLKTGAESERVSYVYKDDVKGLDWWLSFNGSGEKLVAMWLMVKSHASENSES